MTDAPAFDKRACPQEKKYSQDELNKLADAVEKSPAVIKGAMSDYGKLRDKSRACRGER